MLRDAESPSLSASQALDSRLVAYAAAGAGLLLAPAAVQAQTVVYSNPADIVLFASASGTPGATADIDLDGNAVTDFTAMAGVSSDPAFTGTLLQGAAGTRFVRDPSIPFVAALSSGAAIGPGSTFTPDPQGYIEFHSKGSEVTLWPEGVDRYVGVAFKIGVATHYGWVRAQTDASETHASLIIKDWAYNSTPGEAIQAGAMRDPSAVPEPSSLALFAAGGTAALGFLRRRRSVS